MAVSFGATSTALPILGVFLFGVSNTILMKLFLTTTGSGADGQEESFQKPWFLTFVMLIAMSLALPLDRDLRSRARRCGGCKEDVGGPGTKDQETEGGRTWAGKVKLVAAPAILDLLGTALTSAGFTHLPASVWSMMRGAQLISVAVLSVLCLGRKMHSFHCLGISICLAGLLSVSCAAVLESDRDVDDEGDADEVMIGIALCLAGAVVQASQFVVEDLLCKDVDLPALQVVGFEGFFGALAMVAVVFPLLQLVPGDDHGHLEDMSDTLAMIEGSPAVVRAIVLWLCSALLYNISRISVVSALSGVCSVIFDSGRTVTVWLCGLMVHYALDASSPLGEVWTSYGLIKVGGFLLTILGQLVYGEMVRIPGLTYSESGLEDGEWASEEKDQESQHEVAEEDPQPLPTLLCSAVHSPCATMKDAKTLAVAVEVEV